MGRAPVLDGRCSMDQCNNQPNNGVCGVWGVGEEMQMGGACVGGGLLIVFGGEESDEKNENREGNRASDFYGFCWMGGSNNQSKRNCIFGL